MPNYFKTLDFFKYEIERKKAGEYLKDTPGPAPSDDERGTQALKDWSRSRHSYQINGRSVQDILLELARNDLGEFNEIAKPIEDSEGKVVDIDKFNGIEGLRLFFKKYLLSNIKDEAMQEKMCDLALDHFIQSGLPQAANYIMQQKIVDPERDSSHILLQQPDSVVVNFIPLSDGVKIIEENKYRRVKGVGYKFNLLFIPEANFNKRKEAKKKEPMLVQMEDGSISLWGLVDEKKWQLTKIEDFNEHVNLGAFDKKEARVNVVFQSGHDMVDILTAGHVPFKDIFQEEEKVENDDKKRSGKFNGLWRKNQKDYFVQVECTTSFTIDKKDLREKVTLHNVSFDIPDSRFHSMFNKISFIEWLKERLASIMKNKVIVAPAEMKPPNM